MKGRIVVIVGPTASGKTKTAVKLASEIQGEIISCDSMQVYKNMPILTQAPAKKELKAIPHYLVSEISPEYEFSAAEFIRKAQNIICDLIKRNKVPVLTGGTGLYIKTLIDGLFPSPGKDMILRKKLEDKAKKHGSGVLHKILSDKDPDTAAGIHPNDTRRIIRALEIYYLTGIPMTVHKQKTVGIKELYDVMLFGIHIPRTELYERIDRRVEKMFRDGLIPEVKKCLTYRLSITARSALGIKEIQGYLNKEYSLRDAREMLKQNTRKYAKRQMTWFRADKRIRWFSEGKGIIDYCRHIFKEESA